MTPELLYLLLRALLALVLCLFLGALAYLLWRDVRTAAATGSARQRRLGWLVRLNEELPASEGRGVRSYPLLPVTSLGRAPTNTAAVDDETASLEHALISYRGGKWWLEDLGSRNGTTLNGVTIEQPMVVTAGDVIGVGRVRVKLELD